MPSIKELLKEASKQIDTISQCPQKEARILLCYHLKKDINYIFLHENDIVENVEEFRKLYKRRVEGEPIEYIIKSVSFYSEEFFIDTGALIPRPETELLIDEVLEITKEIEKKRITIAEIGTGSGIISIILAKFLKNVKIIATDISKDALKIAKKNINTFDLKDRIELIEGSYLDGVDTNIDILVSNPPYVANDFQIEKPLRYEPREAIFGGVRGDEILKNIITLTKEKNIKYLACEMGYDQKESITKILRKQKFERFHFYKDLAGLYRGFVAKQ